MLVAPRLALCVLLTWCYFGFSAFCWWHTVSVQRCLFCLWINKPTDLAVFNNLRTWDSPQTTCAINTVTLLSWLLWFICSRGVQTICDREREREKKMTTPKKPQWYIMQQKVWFCYTALNRTPWNCLICSRWQQMIHSSVIFHKTVWRIYTKERCSPLSPSLFSDWSNTRHWIKSKSTTNAHNIVQEQKPMIVFFLHVSNDWIWL